MVIPDHISYPAVPFPKSPTSPSLDSRRAWDKFHCCWGKISGGSDTRNSKAVWWGVERVMRFKEHFYENEIYKPFLLQSSVCMGNT